MGSTGLKGFYPVLLVFIFLGDRVQGAHFLLLSDQRTPLKGMLEPIFSCAPKYSFQVVFYLGEVSALFSERETKDDDSFVMIFTVCEAL